jgi:hypothetical protein
MFSEKFVKQMVCFSEHPFAPLVGEEPDFISAHQRVTRHKALAGRHEKCPDFHYFFK